MTTFSKFFSDRAKNLTCKDLLHPDYDSCSSFLWYFIRESSFRCLKYLGPLILIPLVANLQNTTLNELKEKAETYFKMSIGSAATVAFSFGVHCFLCKMCNGIRYFNMSSIPMLVSLLICVDHLPPKFAKIQYLFVNNLLVQTLLRTSDNQTVKSIRESKMVSTMLFMALSSCIMGLMGLMTEESHRYWYAQNFEHKKSENESEMNIIAENCGHNDEYSEKIGKLIGKHLQPMIPWMREKFAERKAKWEASRKGANFTSETIGVSDKIPLRKDVSYDSIELYDENADDAILLKIIGYDGRIVPLRLVSTTTIQEVKFQALKQLVVTNDNGSSSVLGYKLLKSTASMLALNESLSISQSNLSDCDELLLMKCRLTDGNDNESRVQKGPSQMVIDNATADRIQCGEKTESVGDVNEIMLRCDVKSDIRQILISLAKSSAFVIGAGPYAAQIILMFKERLNSSKRPVSAGLVTAMLCSENTENGNNRQ
ncbi:hypothetical protein HA402_006050 [Bradysia odoriphaga]|nr:hypothetical protein HA402_006050 [Bradysia odoriphaga]